MLESMDDPADRRFRKMTLERQACIRKIDNIDRSVEKLLNPNNRKMNPLTNKTKGLVEKHINQYKTILRSAAPMEERMLLSLENKNRELKEELLIFRKNRFATNSYGPHKKPIPRYLDVKN